MRGRRRTRRHPLLPRPAVLLSSLVAFLSLSTCTCFLPMRTPFVGQQHRIHRPTVHSPSRSIPNRSPINSTDTWSRSSTQGGGESRFGVRRRVREVLKKAKSRTGRTNGSADVIAEAASIGGLIEQADLVFAKDYAPPKVQDTNGFTPTTPVTRPSNMTGLVLESPDSEQQTSVDTKTAEPTAAKSSTAGVSVDSLLNAEQLVDPLPFQLPQLSQEQRDRLAAGDRIQEQSKMGREGSGFVVLDVKAPPYVVWECLLDFEDYPQYISTVKSMSMFTNTHLASSYLAEKPVLPGTGREMRHYGTASISRASFVLSKFKLKIAAVHKYQPHPDGHYMVFTLDRACKNVVLKDAKGIWYTEQNPDGLGEDVTRVWLLCELKVSSILPTMIVDYVAKRAMPRATNWLRPEVEKMRKALMDEV